MTYPGSTLYPSSTTFPGAVSIITPTSTGLQVQLGGQVLTQDPDVNGVSWYVTDPVSGWDSGAGVARTQTQKARAAGAWSGPRNSTPRSIVITGMLVAPTVDTLQAAVDQLVSCVTLKDTLLTVTRGLSTRSAIVARSDVPDVVEETDLIVTYSIQLSADDPRKFAPSLTAATGLPAATGAFSVPFTVPFTIASTVVSGRCVLTNPGTATGPVVARIDGPVTGPVITHVASGRVLAFGSTVSLNTGEYLLIDMEARTALANGSAPRPVSQRGWSGFNPGSNEWDFSALSGSGQLTVTATPSWL